MLVVGDLTLDEDSHEVTRGGEQIHLTATEFELLRYLMRNPKRVLSKAQILDRVWNYDFGGQANVVELYISYLRKKIDAGREPMIHTMRGVGLRPQARPPDMRRRHVVGAPAASPRHVDAPQQARRLDRRAVPRDHPRHRRHHDPGAQHLPHRPARRAGHGAPPAAPAAADDHARPCGDGGTGTARPDGPPPGWAADSCCWRCRRDGRRRATRHGPPRARTPR